MGTYAWTTVVRKLEHMDDRVAYGTFPLVPATRRPQLFPQISALTKLAAKNAVRRGMDFMMGDVEDRRVALECPQVWDLSLGTTSSRLGGGEPDMPF